MTVVTDDTLPMTPRAMRDEMIVFVLMAALLASVPFTGIYPFFVMQALCFALLACAFNLLIGYGGLLSFGHAMFLGTAGYCTGHALKVWGLPPELGILVGIVAALALSIVTGYISIRRQGIYFSMITNAPTTGPKMVPRPPTNVISTTSPDIDQCTSVSDASWNTMALVAPASPDSAADRTKARSL